MDPNTIIPIVVAWILGGAITIIGLGLIGYVIAQTMGKDDLGENIGLIAIFAVVMCGCLLVIAIGVSIIWVGL